MKCRPASAAPEAVEDNGGLNRDSKGPDRHSLRGTSVRADHAPSAGVGVEPVGIRFHTNSPVWAQPGAGIAPGATLFVDARGEGDHLPRSRGWEVASRRDDRCCLPTLCPPRHLLGHGTNGLPKEGAPIKPGLGLPSGGLPGPKPELWGKHDCCQRSLIAVL